MGRSTRLLPRHGRTIYQAKLRKPGDRLDRFGNTIEGGVIFSRHFEANNPKHAEGIAKRIAKKLQSKIVSITKFHPEHIIGDYKTWGLENIIGVPKERRKATIQDNTTLDEIVYGKR